MTATDAVPDATASREPNEGFVFTAELRYVDGRFEALVRYDGDGETLKAAARQVGVDVEPAADDAAGNRRVRLSGREQSVEQALREYARRATRQGSYTLGDLGLLTW